MIAVDTNVLLRYLLGDEESQAQRAINLIRGSGRVLITDVVLVETIWTLRGGRYALKKDELVQVIQTLFNEPNIRFENGQAVWKALSDYREAKSINGKSADFADALIISKSQLTIAAMEETFEGSYTFDKAAQALPGAKKP